MRVRGASTSAVLVLVAPGRGRRGLRVTRILLPYHDHAERVPKGLLELPRVGVIELTRHDVVYVREGALYGLGGHLAVAEVQEVLRHVAASDPVQALRALALELLEG